MSQSFYTSDSSVQSLFANLESDSGIDLKLDFPSDNKRHSGWFDSNPPDRRQSSSPQPGSYQPSSRSGSTVPSLASSGNSADNTGPSTPAFLPIPEDAIAPSDVYSASTNGFQLYEDSADTFLQGEQSRSPSSASDRSVSVYSPAPSFNHNEPPQASAGGQNPHKSPQQLDFEYVFQASRLPNPYTASVASSASDRYVAPRSDDDPTSDSLSPWPDFNDAGSRFSGCSAAFPNEPYERSPYSPEVPRSRRASTDLVRGGATFGRGSSASCRPSLSASSGGSCSYTASTLAAQSISPPYRVQRRLDPNSEYCQEIRAREAEPDSTVAGVGSGRVLPGRSDVFKRQAKHNGDTNTGYRRAYDRFKSNFESTPSPLITVDRGNPDTEAFWQRIEEEVADETKQRSRSTAFGPSRYDSFKTKLISRIPSKVKSFFKGFSAASRGSTGRGQRWRFGKSDRVNSKSSHDLRPHSRRKTLQKSSSSSYSPSSSATSESSERGVADPTPTLMPDDDWLGGDLGIDVSSFGGS